METNINNIDANNTYYEQKESGEMQTPQETLDRLVLQENQRKEEIISLVIEDLLEHGVSPDRIPTVNFQVVGDIAFILNERRTHGDFYKYSENKGVEFYFSLSGLKGSRHFNYGLEQSGHEYIDGEFYKDGELIPQFLENGEVNPKYIIALDNINFYRDIQSYYGALKTLWSQERLIDFDAESFHRGIVSGVVRIKDLMEYKSHGYISDEEFPQLLARAIQELPNQCSDMRFYENASGTRLGAEVTKAEIDEYLNPTSGNPLITQDVYNDCLRRIEARDKKILQRNNIETQTRGSLEVEKQRNSFTNRLINILD